jgi:predicted RNA-binding Zn ribbon-like protein
MTRPAGTALAPTGGRLCLDFANTLRWRRRAAPEERLGAYVDFVAWARQAGLVSAGEARAMAARAQQRPAEAAGVLRRARRLREAIYRTVSALAARRLPRGADLAVINAAVARGFGRARIVRHGAGLAWQWCGDRQALDRLLGPLAGSTAEVLTSTDLALVRECAAPDCGWLFVDTSRNRSRRWCDMAVCGNRQKARQHYARRRSTRTRSAGGNS